jgi:NAD-dependent deacetylase
MKNIIILTGAGISAESGLSTFRDNGGLWDNHRIEDVATPEAFVRNPELVQRFYNLRRAQLKDVQPNAAHLAIAKLAAQWPGRVTVVTQNVDDLHERAYNVILSVGRKAVVEESLLDPSTPLRSAQDDKDYIIHMHGELKKARCSITEKVYDWEADIAVDTPCPCCKTIGRLRPHIVWFGEIPLHMDLISYLLAECDLFMSIGTSGTVYPAAGFVHEVRTHGRAHTVEINLEPSSGYSLFHEKIYGKAGEVLPEYVEKLLAANDS